MNDPDPQPRVAIGIPSGDMVHTDFAMHFAALYASPGVNTVLVNAKNSLVMIGRNQCVATAQLAKATHLLFLDTDLVFPAATLKRLLAHGKDIVGAIYSRRVAPFHPIGVTLEDKYFSGGAGLHGMKILPTGCLMIRMNVFEKMTKPYFNTRAMGDGILGEDYDFCERARTAGFEIWCDGDLSREVGHIGQQTYRLDAAQKN